MTAQDETGLRAAVVALDRAGYLDEVGKLSVEGDLLVTDVRAALATPAPAGLDVELLRDLRHAIEDAADLVARLQPALLTGHVHTPRCLDPVRRAADCDKADLDRILKRRG